MIDRLRDIQASGLVALEGLCQIVKDDYELLCLILSFAKNRTADESVVGSQNSKLNKVKNSLSAVTSYRHSRRLTLNIL